MNGKKILRKILKPLAFLYDAAEASNHRNARVFFDRSRNASEDALVSGYERDLLIAQTRDLARNNCIVSGFLDRLGDMVLGQGIEPRPTTSSADWNDAALAHWRNWSRDPEGRGLSSLSRILTLCVLGIPLEGGAAIIKYDDGTIEPVELIRFRPMPGDRENPHPYRQDKRGRITHWCIWARDKDGNFSDSRFARWVPAENVITMFTRMRPDQVLPLPKLAVCVNQVRDVVELNNITLKQAKVQGGSALWHQQADEDDEFPVRRRDMPQRDADDPLKRLADALDLDIVSGRGDLKTIAPATPSGTYDTFQKFNLKIIAMSQSIPLDVLMLWFSDGTYASSKATLTQAHEAILQRQNLLVDSILRPLWIWKMANAVAHGLLQPPPADKNGYPHYDAVTWKLPSYEWMDAADATQTETQEVLMGVRTLGEMAHKRGHDLRDILEERAAEEEMVQEIAKAHGIDPARLSSIVMNGGAQPVGIANNA